MVAFLDSLKLRDFKTQHQWNSTFGEVSKTIHRTKQRTSLSKVKILAGWFWPTEENNGYK